MNTFNKTCMMSLGAGAIAMAALLVCGLVGRVESRADQGLPSQLGTQIPAQFRMPTTEDVKRFVDPVVHIEKSVLGGQRVEVHVPFVYDMILETRPDHNGVMLQQSVLKGLYRLEMERYRENPQQPFRGPIRVTVGGVTMFQNSEAKQLLPAPSSPSLTIPSLTTPPRAVVTE